MSRDTDAQERELARRAAELERREAEVAARETALAASAEFQRLIGQLGEHYTYTIRIDEDGRLEFPWISGPTELPPTDTLRTPDSDSPTLCRTRTRPCSAAL